MKNIIICSDGTWQSPESDSPTHVLRLARSIAPETFTGHKQVVFYDWGVGAEGDKLAGALPAKDWIRTFRTVIAFWFITTSRAMRYICSGLVVALILCARWQG